VKNREGRENKEDRENKEGRELMERGKGLILKFEDSFHFILRIQTKSI
jgi:hypothetical protein